LEVPLYRLFYDGDEPPALPNLSKRKSPADIVWGSAGRDAEQLKKFRRFLKRMSQNDQGMLLSLARKMVKPKGT
jgi:hypothetical protein